MDWCPYIKETFNGFGNAIEYLGRYTHRIAITNTRIQSVTDTHVSFAARDYKSGETKTVTLENKGIYPTFPYACVTVRLPENPLLWFSEQPHEVGKFKNHLQTTRISKIQTTVYRTSVVGTLKEVMELWNIHICPACGCQ